MNKLDEKIQDTIIELKQLEKKRKNYISKGLDTTEMDREQINIKRELFELQQDRRKEILEEQKNLLKDNLEKNIISEEEYNTNISDIRTFMGIIDKGTEMEGIKSDIELIKLNNKSNPDLYTRKQEAYRLTQDEFNKQMQNFMKKFTLHEKNLGMISKEQRENILKQQNFDIDDITKNYSVLLGKDIELSEKIINKTFPNQELQSIEYLDDEVVKQELCKLYQIKDSDNIEIYAYNTMNHNTIRTSYRSN